MYVRIFNSKMLLSGPKLKLFSSLQVKKYRREHRMFLVEGYKMVREALSSGWKVDAVIIHSEQYGNYASMVEESGAAALIYEASAKDFARITSQQSPEGIAAAVEIPVQAESLTSADLLPYLPAFLLDSIQDPGNLGTLIRTADWFGFRAIFCSPGCADLFNPKSLRSSMGSVFRIPVFYPPDFSAIVSSNRERIYAATLKGKNYTSVQYRPDAMLLLGNEGNGIQPELLHAEIMQVNIPAYGNAESLNVAAAGAILAAELRRQLSG